MKSCDKSKAEIQEIQQHIAEAKSNEVANSLKKLTIFARSLATKLGLVMVDWRWADEK